MTQMDWKDIYRTLHPSTKEYKLFLTSHGTFSKIEHNLGNKANHKIYKKLE